MSAIGTLPAAQSEAVALWPAEVPGETVKLPPEADQNIPPVALVAGGVAGLYPALRAARLSPTEALRAV